MLLIISKLSYAIVWNATALMTLFHFKYSRFFYPAGDSIALLVLVLVGGTGWVHDDVTYLSNGHYSYYSRYGDDSWLKQAISGGVLALVAMGVHFIL